MAEYKVISGTTQDALDAAISNLALLEKQSGETADGIEAVVIGTSIIKKSPFGLFFFALYKGFEKLETEQAKTAYKLQAQEIKAIQLFVNSAQALTDSFSKDTSTASGLVRIDVPPMWLRDP